MIKVKLDLKFLHWYVALIGEYFRTYTLLSLDASSCYTFNSQEKVGELGGKNYPRGLKDRGLKSSPPPLFRIVMFKPDS